MENIKFEIRNRSTLRWAQGGEHSRTAEALTTRSPKSEISSDKPSLSITIPVYNEAESIPSLYEKVREVCETAGMLFEIVFVDDGSIDETFDILRRLHDQDHRVKVVRFRKNFGQTAAMAAGFGQARGETIISMDGDLQNDPADIPRLLAKLDEGHDVVCGWRKDRKDKLISRKIPSVIANWLIGRITGVYIHDNGCSLKAYRASTIKNVALYGEMHRFIPAMTTLTGARIAEIIVNHHPRYFGKSKYGIARVWKVVLDIATVKMISGFSSRPGLWFGLLTLPCLMLGASSLLIAGGFYLHNLIAEWVVMSTVSFLFFFLAAHLLSLGVIGELFVKTGDYTPKTNLTLTATVLEV